MIKHFNLYKIHKWKITFKGKIFILRREKNGGEGKKSLNKFCWFVQRNREISTKGISEREVFIKRGCVLIKEKGGEEKGLI